MVRFIPIVPFAGVFTVLAIIAVGFLKVPGLKFPLKVDYCRLLK